MVVFVGGSGNYGNYQNFTYIDNSSFLLRSHLFILLKSFQQRLENINTLHIKREPTIKILYSRTNKYSMAKVHNVFFSQFELDKLPLSMQLITMRT